MPMRSKAKRNYPRKKARRVARKIPRSVKSRGVPEWASLTETKPFALLNENQVYQVYNTQLSSFPRAVAVAKAYQQYRIARIEFRVSPLKDTFQAGGPGSVPYLYYMIDRTRNLQAANSVTPLKRAGAKPCRLDDKIIRFSFTPSVLTANFDSAPPPGQGVAQFVSYKMKPWMNTRDAESIGVWNPDTTDHQGILFLVENSGGIASQYKCEMIVEFQFKKPSFEVTPVLGAPPPISLIDEVGEPSEVPT